MTEENKKQIWQPVLASLLVAGIVNTVGIVISHTKQTVIVEQLAQRVSVLEQDFEEHKKEYTQTMQNIHISLTRLQDGLSTLLDDVREITIDHKAMYRGVADEEVTTQKYTRKRGGK
jgi:uncharacterized protein (UPF0335 family)